MFGGGGGGRLTSHDPAIRICSLKESIELQSHSLTTGNRWSLGRSTEGDVGQAHVLSQVGLPVTISTYQFSVKIQIDLGWDSFWLDNELLRL